MACLAALRHEIIPFFATKFLWFGHCRTHLKIAILRILVTDLTDDPKFDGSNPCPFHSWFFGISWGLAPYWQRSGGFSRNSFG
jgi:hypothetical protein